MLVAAYIVAGTAIPAIRREAATRRAAGYGVILLPERSVFSIRCFFFM